MAPKEALIISGQGTIPLYVELMARF
jgi:hypothetical protein